MVALHHFIFSGLHPSKMRGSKWDTKISCPTDTGILQQRHERNAKYFSDGRVGTAGHGGGQQDIRSRNVILIIDKEARVLAYNSPLRALKYSFDDLYTVQHFASYGGGTGVYSFGEYRYFRIVFKDQAEVIITRLMMNNIKNALANLLGVEEDKRFRVVAFIY